MKSPINKVRFSKKVTRKVKKYTYSIGKRPPVTSERSISLCIPYESVWHVPEGTKTCQASKGQEKGGALAFYSDDGHAGHPGYCTQSSASRYGNYKDP